MAFFSGLSADALRRALAAGARTRTAPPLDGPAAAASRAELLTRLGLAPAPRRAPPPPDFAQAPEVEPQPAVAGHGFGEAGDPWEDAPFAEDGFDMPALADEAVHDSGFGAEAEPEVRRIAWQEAQERQGDRRRAEWIGHRSGRDPEEVYPVLRGGRFPRTTPEEHPANRAERAREAAAERERIRRAMELKGVNGYGYRPARGDHNLLARAVFAEGRNTPRDMDSIAFTIVNRVRPRHSSWRDPALRPTLREVLSERGQYDIWPNQAGNGPEGSDGFALSAHPERMNRQERKAWVIAQQAARRALTPGQSDKTDDATFFYATQELDRLPASLAERRFWESRIRNGTLVESPYRSPYRAGGNPPTNYFYRHRSDVDPVRK